MKIFEERLGKIVATAGSVLRDVWRRRGSRATVCDACEGPTRSTVVLRYGCRRLCGECACLYELAVALRKVDGVEGFIALGRGPQQTLELPRDSIVGARDPLGLRGASTRAARRGLTADEAPCRGLICRFGFLHPR
ncbi:MAG: hypothetical protein HYX92_15975 [Chloroflexi bacterium]|nr:hypothetical protein [Chloroflexota bacterium]